MNKSLVILVGKNEPLENTVDSIISDIKDSFFLPTSTDYKRPQQRKITISVEKVEK